MLVLTRKIGEEILIGDDIKITLVRVKGNGVRIGIEAPRDVAVLRGELEAADAVETKRTRIDPETAVFAYPSSQPDAGPAPRPKTPRDRIPKPDARTRQLFSSRMKLSAGGFRGASSTAPLAGFAPVR